MIIENTRLILTVEEYNRIRHFFFNKDRSLIKQVSEIKSILGRVFISFVNERFCSLHSESFNEIFNKKGK